MKFCHSFAFIFAGLAGLMTLAALKTFDASSALREPLGEPNAGVRPPGVAVQQALPRTSNTIIPPSKAPQPPLGLTVETKPAIASPVIIPPVLGKKVHSPPTDSALSRTASHSAFQWIPQAAIDEPGRDTGAPEVAESLLEDSNDHHLVNHFPAPGPIPFFQTPSDAPKEAKWPVAMKGIQQGLSPLTEEQQKIVTKVQDEFVALIGGEDQAANDPEYQDRWQYAQPVSDQRLRARIGEQAYREYEKALVRTETIGRMAAE